MLVQQGLLVFVTSGLLLISVLIVMAVLSPPLFLLSLVTLPWIWHATRIFRRNSNVAYLEVRDRISQTLSRMQESIAGARVIQAFAGQERAVESFTAINEAQRRANMNASEDRPSLLPARGVLDLVRDRASSSALADSWSTTT